jgi:penicillin-binding protein 2
MGPFKDRKRWRSAKPKVERNRSTGNPAAFALLRALIILMFGALILQLINLQVFRDDDFKQRADINALREIPLPSARGLILDRNGQPLVQNSAQFSAAIIPGDLPDRGEAAVYRAVASVLGVPPEEVQAKVAEGVTKRGEYSPAVIKEGVDRDAALQLMELKPHAPGLDVVVEPSRRYLTGSLLSHVLGYVGPISEEEHAALAEDGYLLEDFVGKSGVESTYESVLRGKPGKKFIEVDASGRELKVISERRPIDGSSLVLSIDLDLQRKTAEVLNEYAAGSDNAAAAVMDVKTGELLAMVSLPTFDNNVFSAPLSDQDLATLVDSPGKPLVNHLIAERYAPGSTFKTIVGAGALQEQVAAPWTTITSRGYITVENEFDPNVVYVYPDWAPLGALDFYGGVAMSSNVYFYYLAGGKSDEGFRGLGDSKVAEYARAFGFGEPTGIDLPGESPGLVPDSTWKESEIGEPWTLGDTYNLGIGQGYVAATPLQVLSAISAVANGGELLTPRVVKEYQDNQGNVLQATDRVVRNQVPVNAENLGTLRAAMRQSVTSGVARKAAIGGVEVAGKTGTAEFGPRLSNGKYATHGWFVGFAPYNDPEIAVVVFVQRGSGGDDASPAAAKILDYYFNAPKLAQQVAPP